LHQFAPSIPSITHYVWANNCPTCVFLQDKWSSAYD